MNHSKIKTLGELKASGYANRSVKQEMRDNLIAKLKSGEKMFEGIIGYEETVIPDLERALLSRHNIIFLGLRGQAKTRIARLMTGLMDEYMPVVAGSEMNDDPLNPLSIFAKDLIAEKGDDTPVSWVHRDERYTEKLATPDVSVADLIGDVDPIKAANLRLDYADERVIHFGLIPRSHRGIFVINELPDLQARIQVALFNILQEGDIQIRGFKLRLPLDIQFVFTANPEDYTNRGSIVTPLKDRIESQILTHYPRNIGESKAITELEARVLKEQDEKVLIPELARDLIEQIAFEARESEFVDAKSGVSARLTISAMENLVSAAERRAILSGDDKTQIRVSDFWGVIPAITGKVELVYEGEQEGPMMVAQNLISKAIRTTFSQRFPEPQKAKKKMKRKGGQPAPAQKSLYEGVRSWFEEGNQVDLMSDQSEKEFRSVLDKIPPVRDIVNQLHPDVSLDERYLLKEFLLHGLAEHSILQKSTLSKGFQFGDLLSGMFNTDNMDFGEFDDLERDQY